MSRRKVPAIMGLKNSKFHGLHNRIIKCRSVKALKRVFSADGEDFNVDKRFTTEEYENVTPLWLAARYNDIEVVQLLLEAGADVNSPCCGLKMTPLHMAANNHNVEMVDILLKSGADPNVFDRWNFSPLMYVAIHHEPFVVNQLFFIFVQHGCDINFGACLDSEGQLEHMDNNMDLMEVCAGYQSDYITYVREPTGPTSGTALHLATQNPHLPNESLTILLDAGAVVDKPNLYGQTPLMGAIMDIYYDYHKFVKSHAEILVSRGSKVATQDRRGWTALHYAAQRGSIDCMKLLMRADADCNALSVKQESAVWIVLVLGWREATNFLIANGCEVNRPLNSMTILNMNADSQVCRFGPVLPIEYALCNRDYHTAELLVRAGCRITQDTWLGHHGDVAQAKLEAFHKMLQEQMWQRQQISPLRRICRDVIRAYMGQAIMIKLEQVYLPQPIKDYICLEGDL